MFYDYVYTFFFVFYGRLITFLNFGKQMSLIGFMWAQFTSLVDYGALISFSKKDISLFIRGAYFRCIH